MSKIARMYRILKRYIYILLLLIVTMSLAACDENRSNNSRSDVIEISDLQMALLCDVVYRDELDTYLANGEALPTDDAHSLIRDDYLEDMSNRNLPAELSGFTVVDFDHGDITGFRAAAFKKNNSIVVVYCGTEDFADIVSDIGVATFDFSSQDGQAKRFAEDNANKYVDCNIYVAGYSMGGRLAYLGAETIVDTGHGDKLRRVCTFNGLGVKEALDFSDSKLSNIHGLETKMKDTTVNHIVNGDDISDDWIKNDYGLLHIGKLLYYDCTNPRVKDPIRFLGFEVDMTRHDLYTFIDVLSEHLKGSGEIAVTADISKNDPAIDLNDGIIVVSASVGRNYYYKSTGTYKFTTFTAHLYKIDPETGNVTHIRTFSSEDTHSCSAYLTDIGGYTKAALRNFNSDMTLMTACVTLESGANHIGWIDENGQFTDVSARITTKSDFGALTNHQIPRFFGDYIYFRDFTNTSASIKRVPLNTLTADAVEVLFDDTKWSNTSIYPLPDGTVLDEYSPFDYYDSSMQYPARVHNTYDWISADTCIGNGNGRSDPYTLYKYHLSGKIDLLEWYRDKTTLIPSIKDRINWNAVVSPECDQVAFLSKLTTGTDQSISMFLISIDGGEPVKVHTDFSFSANTIGLIDWR